MEALLSKHTGCGHTHAYPNYCAAILFVVDPHDTDRLPEVQSVMVKLLSEPELRDAVLLVLANKMVRCVDASAKCATAGH